MKTAFFKPDTIPQNYEEYIALCDRNENSTLLEYANILKTIVTIKASENLNCNKEVKEIRTIYDAIYQNSDEEIEKINSFLIALKS